MILLQWYITRELLKTFALAAIGLTILFSMGGGVLNMIQADVMTAVELGQILGFVVPVATTLTLPIAALFSAAMVYGRLSADNEFDACRSSGINVVWLLSPAVLLSIGVCVFTFSFSNFVIPRFGERLEQIIRSDPQKIMIQTMQTKGHLSWGGKYVLYADHYDQAEINVPDDSGHSKRQRVLDMTGAAFIELENGELIRYGTAPRITIMFNTDARHANPIAEAHLADVRLFDESRKQFYALGDQPLGPVEIPWPFRRKPKWMDLYELLYYRAHPCELPEIQQLLERLRGAIEQYLFYQGLVQALSRPDGSYTIGSAEHGYEIRAEAASLDPESHRPELVKPVVRQWWGKTHRTLRADHGSINIRSVLTEAVPAVQIHLGETRFRDDVDPEHEIARSRVVLEAVPLPQEFIERADGYTDAELLDSERPLGLAPKIDDQRVGLHRTLKQLERKVITELHGRTAFSMSVIVLVLMGATLGIVFRGGEMLTAFVIAFVPGLFVTVMIIMGRQLAEKPHTLLVGIAVIWSSLLLVAIADGVVIHRYLRR